MQVYALVGKSGTGKSHQALFVAKRLGIEYIVDDGLLIKHNKRIAGSSAKRESSYISAVKRAIFHDDKHRQLVISALERERPSKLLLIGTSDAMVEKIANRLAVSPIKKIVYITEFSTAQDLAAARLQRDKYGKHVVPVPSVEIKGDFSGYFLDKLKLFHFRRDDKTEIVEKTIVRPTFSYLGRFTISNRALSHIVEISLKQFPAVVNINRIRFNNVENGVIVEIDLTLALDTPINKALTPALKAITEYINEMTQLNVLAVNITVKSLLHTGTADQPFFS